MGIITAIMSLLGSSAVGSIIGGAFAFLNKKNDLAVKQMELNHEVSKWAHDAAMQDKHLAYAAQEALLRKDVAIIEADGSIEQARMQAIAAVQSADKITADELKQAGGLRWLLVLASAFQRLIRPFATVIVAGAALYINAVLVLAFLEQWKDLPADQRMVLATTALSWLGAQASAVLGYWFVARGSSK